MGALFLGGAALAAGSVISRGSPMPEAAAASPRRRCEVVSFHMDRPYLDTSGTATPYHPPRGMRSASPVAHLSEEAFRTICCYA